MAGTRSGTRALKMAELQSRDPDGLALNPPGLAVSPSDNIEDGVPNSGKKSLRDQAAEIARRITSKSDKGKKSQVATDAGQSSNDPEVSDSTRQTRTSDNKDGGAHEEASSGEEEEVPVQETSGSKSGGKSSNRGPGNNRSNSSLSKDSSSSRGGSGKSPPAKKSRSEGDGRSGLDISLELLGEIKNLNSSLNQHSSQLTEGVSGMRKDLGGLANSMSENFSRISRSLDHGASSEEEDESSSSSDSDQDTPGRDPDDQVPKVKIVIDHPISDEEGDSPHKKSSREKVTDKSKEPLRKDGKQSLFAKKRAQIVKVRQTGDPIDEDLAVILSDKFWVENVLTREVFVDKVQKSLRPDNVPSLQVPAIQDFIWKELPENIRGRDKWDKLTQANLMLIWRELAGVINLLGPHESEAPWVSEVIEKLLEVFELAGYVNSFNFTNHRREVIRPVLPPEYKRLASDSFPPTPEWLLGDELSESVEKISKENKLTEKMFPKQKAKRSGGVVSKKRGHHHKNNQHNRKKGKKTPHHPKGRKDSMEY